MRPIQRGGGLALIGTVFLLAWQSSGWTENWLDRDGKAELRRDGTSQPPDSNTASSKDFTVELTLPARYSSNVASASVDSIVEKRGDSHVGPDLNLKWARQYDWAKLSAEVGAGTERYLSTHDANIDSLYSTFKIQMTDGKSERFVPYALVSNSVYFLPTFHSTDIIYQDVVAGFYTGIGWRDKDRIPYRDALIPRSDATEPGDVAVTFDARIGRRISDVTDYQNTFVAAKAELGYTFSRNWRIDAASKFRASWYENYHGERRTDYRPGAEIGLTWTPDWLAALVKRSELSMNFGIYRNFSNIPDKTYTLWDVGPTLSLRTKF